MKTYNADDSSLVGGVGDGAVWETDTDFGHVVGGGVDAAHDTLVIALEEDGDEGEELDEDVELARGEALPEGGVAHCSAIVADEATLLV